MGRYSGQTLEELESIFNTMTADSELLIELYQELTDRKRRRETSGKSEKPRATQLRLKAEARLGAAMAASTKTAEPRLWSSVGAKASATEFGMRPNDLTQHQGAPRSNRSLGFRPTDEQLAALDAFRSGGHLKINAFAGAGKTSTLALLSQNSKGCGIYAAFNRACVRDSAGRFASNVQCCTLHALAFRSVRKQFRTDKLTGKLNPNIVLSHVKLSGFDHGSLKLTDKQLASLSLATLRQFAYSRAQSVREIRVPQFGIVSLVSKETAAALTATVHETVESIWRKMCDPTSSMPLGHDGYLKYWALQHPRLGVDFILLDEAQDTNDVVLDILERQNSQIVYVGDRHQQIYEWRGAVNAIEKAHASRECYLTQSFRFGESIAGLANAALRHLGESTKLRGNDNVQSRIAPLEHPNAIIARTNGAVLAAVMTSLQNGDIPYVEGGTDELKRLIRGVYELKDNGFSTVPEFFGFESWDEVVQYSETEYGKELATFVQMVQTYGCGTLWHVLKNVADDPKLAAYTVSTTHKAKGREWDAVRLEDDFLSAEEDENGHLKPPPKEEVRILYVALTRAKQFLQIGEQARRFLAMR